MALTELSETIEPVILSDTGVQDAQRERSKVDWL